MIDISIHFTEGNLIFTDIYILTMYSFRYPNCIYIIYTLSVYLRTMRECKLGSLQATEGSEVSIIVRFVSKCIWFTGIYIKV